MKRRITIGVIAVVSILAAPWSGLYAQCSGEGCTPIQYECPYNNVCATHYESVAVYDCDDGLCYVPGQCCLVAAATSELNPTVAARQARGVRS